jgi:glycosyltransferase involved in cell wall biosynthesis
MTEPERRIRLIFVVSQAMRWVAFEWMAARLSQARFDISFLLPGRGASPLSRHLEATGISTHPIPYSGKNAVGSAARAVARFCRDRDADIVHTHFMDACLAGLLGARIAGVPVRVHTRHHAGPYPWYHRAPWGSLYDRWNNWLSTMIIAPSEQARRALVDCDRVSPRKVIIIPHGFDLEWFRDVPEALVDRIRAKYGLAGQHPVIGVVARYERIKGVEPIILAFRRLLDRYPAARLVLANARGSRIRQVRQLLRTLPDGCYTEIPFEEQMPALYRTFDVFVHAPIDPHLEAFGQVYVEAMAAGVPCVCAPAGAACEFLDDGTNAVVIPPDDPDQICAGVIRVLDDPAFCARLTAAAWSCVEERFGLDRMIRSLENLYIQLYNHSRASRR